MKRRFALVFALALFCALPVLSAAASYDEHTQNDGMWHVEDSKGGAASSVIISAGVDGLTAGTKLPIVGKNRLSGFILGSSINVSTGAIVSGSSNVAFSEPILFRSNEVCYLSNLLSVSSNFVAAYDWSGRYIGRTSGSSVIKNREIAKNVFTLDLTGISNENIAYLRISLYAATGTNITSEVASAQTQFETGSTSTPYEPYTNPTTLTIPSAMLNGDLWDVLSGTVTRSNGSVEFYEPQAVTLPVGTVNIFSTGDVQPGQISITYNYDPSGSGGSGGTGGVSGGISDFLGAMSATLGVFQMQLSIYGYTFSLWQIFIFTCLIAIVMDFVWGLIG